MGRWSELAALAAEPNPFFEPAYILPLARAFGQQGDVRLLVARDSEEWLACLPVHFPRRWHRIPLRSLAIWRGHVLYGLLGTPLVNPDRASESLAALLDGTVAGHSATFSAIEWVAEDGPLAKPFAAALERRSPTPIRFERFERAALWRRPEQTYLEETLSSKHRRELRRQRRKLGEALGGEPELVDRGGEDSAYDDFIALEAAGRKGAHGTVLAAEAGHAAFFKEMCRGYADLGRLQLLELQAGGRTVAAKCNLIAGKGIFCLKIAYDEKWSSLSPGIQLEIAMLKFFHEESETLFMDSCADPNNAMINRLWPDRRTLSTFVLPAHGVRGRAARTALEAARSLRNRKRDRKSA
jgi:CelD/BcsL family acetyltransferase involved in cellulose biosynthesis